MSLNKPPCENKAQGAIEYLLIIGAALLVVAIVTIAITSILGQAQDQTITGGNSAYDSLHDLAVGGLGYNIEIGLSDYSAPQEFPTPSGVDCKDPTTGTQYACFNGKPIVYVFIDGKLIDQQDLTGINGLPGIDNYKVFKYNFPGDPNTKHRLTVTYEDCWAGGGATKLDPSNPANALINDNLYKINSPGVKCSDASVLVGALCTICNDNNLWDKNIKLWSLKITNSDGKEVPVAYDIKWSTPIVDLNFQ